jgi:hypothetical protein
MAGRPAHLCLADFVHIFDVASGYMQAQRIELFGEIAGTRFTPDGQLLYIANADDVFGALHEFEMNPVIRIPLL